MRYMTRKGISWILAAFLAFGCGSKSSTGPDDGGSGGTKGTVITGERTQIASQSMGAGGGTIRIEKTGDPLNGLEITIPAGAFAESRNIALSEAAVTSHSLGTDVTALSPLITVKNAPGYADKPITVKIPVTVPEGSLAMGVLYNESTGKIEGLPLVELTPTSVTVALRTFTPSPAPSASSGKGLFKALGREQTAVTGDILVVSVEESRLSANPVISTGFTPGVDDWEFINRGSYISPGGHCAGQSMSAMWYYYEKKLHGGASLHHQFDRVQDSRTVLWQDNPRGYRFASTVQEDLDWDSLSRQIFLTLRETPEYHHLSWKCFALSMYLTGEPQYVGLKSDKGGHAIIAYKIDYANGILSVADPNYPGQERKIRFNGAQFDPYSTKQNDNEPSDHPYTGIGYFAKSSLVDWSKIGERWKELENATIGGDRFPQYRLWVTDAEGGHELTASEVVNADSIVVQVQWKNGVVDNDIAMSVFDGKGAKISPEPAYARSSAEETIHLQAGENILGFHIEGNKGTASAKNWRWLDFQWIPVISSTLRIEPEAPSGKKNVEITFTAVSDSPPEYAKYLWDFGDGTPEVSVLNKTQVKHTYTADGNYTVTLRLHDARPSPEKLLGTATVSARIGAELGKLRNVILTIPGGGAMYGLDIDAGWDDSVALTTNEITLHVKPRFTPSSGVEVTSDIPVEYRILVDEIQVKSGTITLEPTSDGKNADGYADVNIGRLPKGEHTIRLELDPGMKITDPLDTDRDQYQLIDHEISVVESYF